MRSANTQTLPLGLTLGFTALVVTAIGAHPAHAQETGDLLVTASIPEGCTVQGGTLDFGPYNPVDTDPLEGLGSFDVTCVTAGNIVVSLDGGNNQDGNFRNMERVGGTELLAYRLTDNNGTLWGDGSGLGVTMSRPVVLGGPQSIEVSGHVVQQQSQPPGNYSDTVTITVTPE